MENLPGGFMGRILRINLSNRQVETKNLDFDVGLLPCGPIMTIETTPMKLMVTVAFLLPRTGKKKEDDPHKMAVIMAPSEGCTT